MAQSLLFLILLFVIKLVISQRTNEPWECEFNNPSDLNKFIQETGDLGWANDELQDYTTRNAIIRDGFLSIITEKNPQGYSSSRLKSKNSFRYGTFKMRAKLPRGRGTWPAFWMLADNIPFKWPRDGEIDIMEHVGYHQNIVHGSIHTGKYNHKNGTQKGEKLTVEDVSDKFHVYKLVWSPSSIKIYIDDKLLFQYDREPNADYNSWPFDNYFHIVINTAVGGWWGGKFGVDDSVFPQKYIVDYVRFTPLQEKPQKFNWKTDSVIGFKWASQCDFEGNDLANAQVPGARCSSTCANRPGCTHFSWNQYNGGTCWMKKGTVNRAEAVKKNEIASVCGYKN